MSEGHSVHSNNNIMDSFSWNFFRRNNLHLFPAIAEDIEAQKGNVTESLSHTVTFLIIIYCISLCCHMS